MSQISQIPNINPETQQDSFEVVMYIDSTRYNIVCEYEMGVVKMTATDPEKNSFTFEKDAKGVLNMVQNIFSMDSFGFYSILKQALLNHELARCEKMEKHTITGKKTPDSLNLELKWYIDVVGSIVMEKVFDVPLEKVERSEAERMGMMLQDFISERDALLDKIQQLEKMNELLTDAIHVIYTGLAKFTDLPSITLV